MFLFLNELVSLLKNYDFNSEYKHTIFNAVVKKSFDDNKRCATFFKGILPEINEGAL